MSVTRTADLLIKKRRLNTQIYASRRPWREEPGRIHAQIYDCAESVEFRESCRWNSFEDNASESNTNIKGRFIGDRSLSKMRIGPFVN
jgi:hypothetical protein